MERHNHQRGSVQSKAMLLCAAILAYLAVFAMLNYYPGRAQAIGAIIPVMTVAWLFGMLPGIVAAIISMPVNMLVCVLFGVPDWWDKIVVQGGISGTVGLVLIGAVVGRVRELHLRLLRSGPRGAHQNRLFGEGEAARDAARRDEALARLAALFGPEAVVRPVAAADHRLEHRWRQAAPEGRARPSAPAADSTAPRPAGATALRLLPQPEELVAVQAGGRLVGFRRGRTLLELSRLAGPRRLTGGWWQRPWARDEYELLTAQGGRYRIARDTLAGRWLLLAEAD